MDYFFAYNIMIFAGLFLNELQLSGLALMRNTFTFQTKQETYTSKSYLVFSSLVDDVRSLHYDSLLFV